MQKNVKDTPEQTTRAHLGMLDPNYFLFLLIYNFHQSKKYLRDITSS